MIEKKKKSDLVQAVYSASSKISGRVFPVDKSDDSARSHRVKEIVST